ncbi:hypothetical protein [Jeotgalibacillus soli]|uniref:Uncharacterized protein n=1 Tax=Jeotgalibacillus soli TaxID=889306 RepID=A0A0C2VCQ5_9BACL|nr:hypothetical protein [Jeotgalibacillus soli]KIL46727.1 hypothetical protein KP78_18450 [Jeotgalibacillus soli]
MFSVLLELPEFEVIKQEIVSTHYVVHVKKKADEENSYPLLHQDFVG